LGVAPISTAAATIAEMRTNETSRFREA
jgi:hypothetical protein